MKFTYYGHSCFQIESGNHTLLFDPFIQGNELAKEVDISSIHPEVILLSHGHQDHVADVEQIALANQSTIIANFEIVSYYQNKGIEGHPMNHGGKAIFPFGEVKMVQAVHSSVLPDGTYAGNPGGFVLRMADRCFYYAGDTALTHDMKLIPDLGYQLDFAILPIGDNFTMGVEEAIVASDFIQCDTIIGVHYDTFGYIRLDHSKARQAFEKSGKQLLLLEIGQQIEL